MAHFSILMQKALLSSYPFFSLTQVLHHFERISTTNASH